MTSIWTIKHEPSGVTKTADEWGFGNIGLDIISQSPDTARLTIENVAYDSANLWSYKDLVTIYRDGVKWFQGVVVATPRSGQPDYEGATYQLAGGWWWFDNTAYLKEWASLTTEVIEGETVTGSDSQYLGYARLFINNNGEGISTSAALTEIVNYAINAGAPLQLGALPQNAVIPWASDVRDASVAQVIRQVLRWHPDVTPWFDYSTTPPTLNFSERDETEEIILDADGSHGVEAVDIRSRDDLKPPAVCIHYEITDKVDDQQYRSIVHDIAPAGQTCNQPGAVNVTIPLRGRQITTQTESVRVTPIPDNQGEGGLESNETKGKEWWRRHYSILQNTNIFSDLLIKIVVDEDPTKVVQFAQELEEDHPEEPLLKEARKLKQLPEPEDYPNELVDGSLDDWMDVHARELVVRSKIYYLGDIEDLPKEMRAQFPLFDNSEHPETGGKYYNTAEVTVMGTDARRKNYNRTVSFHEAEVVPDGLAQHIYNQLSLLQWEGTVALAEKETGSQQIMGKALNILSGHPAWATMKAQIQQVSYDVDAGSTVITFGPAEHLAPQDLVEQLRLGKVVEFVFKEKPAEAELNTRDGKQIVGGYVQPKANSLWGPGSKDDLGRSCLTPKNFIVPADANQDVKLVLHPCQMASFGNNDGGVPYPVKYGADTLDDNPEIPLEDGENTIWAKWTTDKNGVIEADSVEVVTTEPTGTQPHVPESPVGSGQTGIYKQKCLVINVPAPAPADDGSSRNPTWYPVSPGLIWNVFDRELYSEGGGIDIAKEITNNELIFRSINQLLSDPQVQVILEGDLIRIRGNGFDGDITLGSSPLIQVKDGLVTQLGDLETATLSYCDGSVIRTGEFLKLP